jgi:hypothetical protein
MNLLIGQLMDAIRIPSGIARFERWGVRQGDTIACARPRDALIERSNHRVKESKGDE